MVEKLHKENTTKIHNTETGKDRKRDKEMCPSIYAKMYANSFSSNGLELEGNLLSIATDMLPPPIKLPSSPNV